MTTNIYVLRLTKGKWYVGKSADPHRRYEEHCSGLGSQWTKLYHPLALEKVFPNASPLDEDKYTKEWMMKYGIDNVRGGSYANVDLDEIQTTMLKREFRGATDCCTRCGRTGHWVSSCYARTDVEGNDLDETEDEEEDVCYRCKRPGHFASKCYARTDVEGNKL